MNIVQLTGSASRVRQVIDHFSLRSVEEHSATRVDVQVEDSQIEDVVDFAETVGVRAVNLSEED